MRQSLAAVLLLLALVAPARAEIGQAEVDRFFDRLMDLGAYGKYREFYDAHIEKQDISYDTFRERIEQGGVQLRGSSESRLVGFDRQGKRTSVAADLVLKHPDGSDPQPKRFHIMLSEKNGRAIVASKELFKVFEARSKRTSKASRSKKAGR